MKKEEPDLADLTRRLAECPADFLEITAGNGVNQRVIALIADWFRSLNRAPVDVNGEPFFERLQSLIPSPRHNRYFGLLSVITWLLYDDWFRRQSDPADKQGDSAEQARRVFTDRTLEELAELIPPKQFVEDPDRREELVRLCLARVGARPKGETAAQSSDRLATLNSVERQRVMNQTVAAEKRAREIREAMAKKKALESASRYGE